MQESNLTPLLADIRIEIGSTIIRPETISASTVVFGESELLGPLVVKFYTANGFPENEFTAFKTFAPSGIKIPSLIEQGQNESGLFGIFSRLKGKDGTMALETLDIQKVGSLIRNVCDELLKLRELGSYSSIMSLPGVTKGWLNPSEMSLQDFVSVSNSRVFKYLSSEQSTLLNVDEHIRWINSFLPRLSTTFYYTHGDLTLNNIILDDSELSGFVDLEYSYIGPQEKDLGDLFFSLAVKDYNFPIEELLTHIKPEFSKPDILFYLVGRCMIELRILVRNNNHADAISMINRIKELRNIDI